MRGSIGRSTLIVEKRLKMAILQFPFLPLVKTPDLTTLSEPDGGLSNWLLGEEKREPSSPTFSDLPLPNGYKNEVEEYFASEYQDWLFVTVTGLLEWVTSKKSPHIILFPEYSLPTQIDRRLEDLLLEHSENRCIVAGTGSVSKRATEGRKNRFCVVHNGEMKYGEKVVPTDIEQEEFGIERGKGPLLYPIALTLDSKEASDFFIEISMCSDYIERVKTGSDVQKQLLDECKKRKVKREAVLLCLIPSFTPKTGDMQHARTQALRGGQVVALANPSFFGESFVFCPPATRKARIDPLVYGPRGEPMILYAEIPLSWKSERIFLSSTIGSEKGRIDDVDAHQERYKVVFADERKKPSSPSLTVDSESFFSIISRRLNGCIALSGILFRSSDPKHGISTDKTAYDFAVVSSEKWKKLQESVNKLAGENAASYREALLSDMIAVAGTLGVKDLYTWVLDELGKYVEPANRKELDHLRDFVTSQHIPPPIGWEPPMTLQEMEDEESGDGEGDEIK